MQTKSGKHETCRDVMISYVEDVLKILEGLVQVIAYNANSTSFMIFGLPLHFIEFKNNSFASSWSCFVNKMFEILGLFLDTASHYTQYHKYHFLNH